MSQDVQQLFGCVSLLVEILTSPNNTSPEKKNYIYNQLLPLVDNIEQHYSYDLTLVVNECEQIISESNDWRQFQELIKTLLRFRDPDQIAAYLIFICSFDEKVLGHNNPTRHQYSMLNRSFSQTRQPAFARVGNNAVESLSGFHNSRAPSRNSSIFVEPFVNTTGTTSNKRHRSNFSRKSYDNQTMHDIVNALYSEFNPDYIDESEMLQYIFYTLLGSTSELFPVNNGPSIQIPDSVSNSHSGILHMLFEASLLYKYLVTTSKHNYKSQVKIAFVSQLQSFLQDYMKVINNLSLPNNNLGNTLIDIYNHMTVEIDRFRYLYFLTNQLESLEGNEFLSLVFGYTNFGDILIKSVSKSLFKAAAEPYYKILENWLLNGELTDRNNEFFITFDSSHSGQFSLITGLKFDFKKFPMFLPAKTGKKVFQIGKMIVFLRQVCKEYNFLNRYNQKYKQCFRSGHEFNENQFSLLIDAQYEELSSYFTSLMYNNYKMDYHIVNLKKFLLLSKGDFIASLAANASTVLNEPSQTLSTIQLSQLLTDSLYNSSVKRYPRDIHLRLDARILSLNTSANLGWDVFTLDYKLEDPLSLIIYDEFKGLKSYLKLFNFLWKLKRASHFLERSWLNSNRIHKQNLKRIRKDVLVINLETRKEEITALSHTDQNKLLLLDLFKKANIIRNAFLSFVTKVYSYLNFRVIDIAFEELFSKLTKSKNMFLKSGLEGNSNANIKKLHGYMLKYNRVLLPKETYIKKSNQLLSNLDGPGEQIPSPEVQGTSYESYSIDEIISIHSEYLLTISTHKLIDSSRKSTGPYSGKLYIHQINHILSLVFKFLQSEEEFHSLILDQVSQLELEGDDSDLIIEDSEQPERKFSLVFQHIDNLYQEFKEKKRVFVKDLINDNILRYLGLSLNG